MQDLRNRSQLNQLAMSHYPDTVGNALNYCQVVGNKQNSQMKGPLEIT